jgi:hypothetical protein
MWLVNINKTDRHDITEILLKVALNTITPYTLIIDVSFVFGVIYYNKINIKILTNSNQQTQSSKFTSHIAVFQSLNE